MALSQAGWLLMWSVCLLQVVAMRFPVPLVLQHLAAILEGILLWADDSKNQFKLKVSTIWSEGEGYQWDMLGPATQRMPLHCNSHPPPSPSAPSLCCQPALSCMPSCSQSCMLETPDDGCFVLQQASIPVRELSLYQPSCCYLLTQVDPSSTPG